jgi:hypothetical protein
MAKRNNFTSEYPRHIYSKYLYKSWYSYDAICKGKSDFMINIALIIKQKSYLYFVISNHHIERFINGMHSIYRGLQLI